MSIIVKNITKYYEDIEKNALTGSMAILDANNIISNTPLQGNERVVFKLSTPGTEGKEQIIDASEETGYPFHIYAITDRKILSETLMSYNIHFCFTAYFILHSPILRCYFINFPSNSSRIKIFYRQVKTCIDFCFTYHFSELTTIILIPVLCYYFGYY